jgi:hypothetical protein
LSFEIELEGGVNDGEVFVRLLLEVLLCFSHPFLSSFTLAFQLLASLIAIPKIWPSLSAKSFQSYPNPMYVL